MFDKTKKVLCVIQVVEDSTAGSSELKTVMPHEETEKYVEDEVTKKDLDSVPFSV